MHFQDNFSFFRRGPRPPLGEGGMVPGGHLATPLTLHIAAQKNK